MREDNRYQLLGSAELKAGDGLKVGEEIGGRGVEAKGLLVELRGGSAALPK